MSPDESLKELGRFLCDRREEITTRWVEAVGTDPAIAKSTKLPHEQLMDHLPKLFDDLTDTLSQSVASAESCIAELAVGQTNSAN